MVPDLELQLDVVLKALGEVVMPALPPTERIAAEQLGLSIATLGLVRSRLALEPRRSRAELANALALAEGIAALAAAPELHGALASGRALLADPNPQPGAFAEAVQCLSTLSSAAVDASEGEEGAAIDRMVVERSGPIFDLARAWGLPAGFEPDPDEVPPLDALLGIGGAQKKRDQGVAI